MGPVKAPAEIVEFNAHGCTGALHQAA